MDPCTQVTERLLGAMRCRDNLLARAEVENQRVIALAKLQHQVLSQSDPLCASRLAAEGLEEDQS